MRRINAAASPKIIGPQTFAKRPHVDALTSIVNEYNPPVHESYVAEGRALAHDDSMTMPFNAPLAILATLLLEVMDKEPPLAERAAVYGALSLTSILLARKRWWFGLTVLPVAALFGLADVSELHDPFVGPEIVREAGLLHVVLWYVLILTSIVIPIFTAAIVRHRKSSQANCR